MRLCHTLLSVSLHQFLTSSDELSTLVRAIRYVELNEPSVGRVILVHCYQSVSEIPTELESNHQLVDEAFPHITVDLVFAEADFSAATLWFLSKRLGVSSCKFFVSRVTRLKSTEEDRLLTIRLHVHRRYDRLAARVQLHAKKSPMPRARVSSYSKVVVKVE